MRDEAKADSQAIKNPGKPGFLQCVISVLLFLRFWVRQVSNAAFEDF